MPAAVTAPRRAGTRYREKDHEKALLFHELCARGTATRKDLIRSLSLRPTSVSHAVQELVEERLVGEERGMERGRSGRPELLLRPSMDRLTAIAIDVESREIAAALLDIGNGVLASDAVALPQESGNDAVGGALQTLVKSMAARVPGGSELLGAGLSLVGTVDPARKSWVSAARWPRLRDLDVRHLEKAMGIEFRIRRNLDAELESVLSRRPDLPSLNVCLFHWGFGIGSAYSCGGRILGSALGRFGEIGHTKVAAAGGRRCLCGSEGCMETLAALWAVLPELETRYGRLAEDERDLEPLLRDPDLADVPAMGKAVEAVGEGLTTLYRLFYPDVILLKGPLFSHPGVYGRILDRFEKALPDYARGRVRLEPLASAAVPGTAPAAASGAVAPFFRSRLDQLLRRKT